MSDSFAIDQAAYSREHAFASEVRRDQTKFIDQTILTLSGGALGISITFFDKFIGPSGVALPYLLALAWLVLIWSVLLVLLGMHVSQRAIERHLDDLEKFSVAPLGTKFPSNPWAKFTETSNKVASVLFAVGLICLAIFAFANYAGNLSKRTSDMTNPITRAPNPLNPGAGWVPRAPAAPPPPPPSQAPPQKGK